MRRKSRCSFICCNRYSTKTDVLLILFFFTNFVQCSFISICSTIRNMYICVEEMCPYLNQCRLAVIWKLSNKYNMYHISWIQYKPLIYRDWTIVFLSKIRARWWNKKAVILTGWAWGGHHRCSMWLQSSQRDYIYLRLSGKQISTSLEMFSILILITWFKVVMYEDDIVVECWPHTGTRILISAEWTVIVSSKCWIFV